MAEHKQSKRACPGCGKASLYDLRHQTCSARCAQVLRSARRPSETVLVISDTQYPFAHRDHLDFLKAVADKYPPTSVVHIGDECFDGDAEVLTKDGWTVFRELTETTRIMQFTMTGTLELVTPLRLLNNLYTGEMITRRSPNYYSRTTAGHNLVLRNKRREIVTRPAGDVSHGHYSIVRAGVHNGPGIPQTDDEIRLAVALSADFSVNPCGSFHGGLKKPRKLLRLAELLGRLGIRHSAGDVAGRPGVRSVYINNQQGLDFCTKLFDHSWLTEMTSEQKLVLLAELEYGDGYSENSRNRLVYCSSKPGNIEFVQTLAHLCGIEATVRTVRSEFGESQQVAILLGKTCTRADTHNTVEAVVGERVYCATVPSGMLLVRQQGKITVSGNCDFHALSDYDHDPDGDSPGAEYVKALVDMHILYKEFPNVRACISNHTARPYRRAFKFGIPSTFLKGYAEFLEAPGGWAWADRWEIDNVLYEHGEGCAGKFAHLKAAEENMQSTVMGHLHANAGVAWSANPKALLFGMAVGCLMDTRSYACRYGRTFKRKPILGCGVVQNGLPLFVPMLMKEDHRWVKTL
jgi:hypothetical protein